MRTIPWPRASASLLLLSLALVAQEPAPAEPEPGGPTLAVPAGETAPVLDGAIDEAAWSKAESIRIGAGDDIYSTVKVMRVGRELYLGLRSRISPWASAVHLVVTDPLSKGQVTLIIAPGHPTRSPVAAFRKREQQPERLSAATCDVRFGFDEPDGGFRLEARIPLALLEIPAREKSYDFSIMLWDLKEGEPIGAFPITPQGPKLDLAQARMESAGAWGSGTADTEWPPQPAIALLEEIDSEDLWRGGQRESGKEPRVLAAYLGVDDGRRQDAPLAALEQRLRKLVQAYPDYLSLGANLVRVLRGRNDFDAALAAERELETRFPLLKKTPWHVIVQAQLIRDAERYDEAMAFLQNNIDVFEDMPRAAAEFQAVRNLQQALGFEERMREQDATRDLPRVRLKTSRGEIVLELFEDDAPNAVANFVSLVEKGFYDGLPFHWVDSGGRVVGGDPNARDDDPKNDGFGGPGYLIESDPGRRLHLAYTVAFVDRRDHRRTEGSAFAIQITAMPSMDGINTVFGRVLEGRDVVRRLEYRDTLEQVVVVRKRAHDYVPVKRPPAED